MRTSLIRPTVAWLHRYFGLLLVAFLIIASLTGTALVFRHELDAALNPELFDAPTRATPRLSLTQLADAVTRQVPGARVEQIYLDGGVGHSIRVRIKPASKAAKLAVNEAFVDPYDGRLLGTRKEGAVRLDRVHLVPMLFRLHQQLLIEPPLGKWITGGVALVWLLHSVSGLYLSLPRSLPFWSRWRQAWLIKRGASPARLEMDLHRAGGLWAWLLCIMLAFSAVYFNLRKELFVPAISVVSRPTTPLLEQLPKRKASGPVRLDHDAAVAAAFTALGQAGQGHQLRYVQYQPEYHAYRVALEAEGQGERALAVSYEQVLVDADDGRLLARNSYAQGSAADRLMAWQFPLHTGQALGLPGRVLIFLSGLAVAVISVTGLLMWLRKRRVAAKTRSRQRLLPQTSLTSTP
ncbi:MAG TPA: PepSY-associated TM helix domain-containing protein [Chitinimonas sp.]